MTMSHNFVFPCVDLDLANGYGYREIQNFCMHVTELDGARKQHDEKGLFCGPGPWRNRLARVSPEIEVQKLGSQVSSVEF